MSSLMAGNPNVLDNQQGLINFVSAAWVNNYVDSVSANANEMRVLLIRIV